LSVAHARFLEKLEPVVDDATFELVLSTERATTGNKEAGSKTIDAGVDGLHVLLALKSEGNLAVGLLNEADGIVDASSLQPLRERFIACCWAHRRDARPAAGTGKSGWHRARGGSACRVRSR